jgi:hypothetical protein
MLHHHPSRVEVGTYKLIYMAARLVLVAISLSQLHRPVAAVKGPRRDGDNPVLVAREEVFWDWILAKTVVSL